MSDEIGKKFICIRGTVGERFLQDLRNHSMLGRGVKMTSAILTGKRGLCQLNV